MEKGGFAEYAKKDAKIQEEVKTGEGLMEVFDELNKIVSFNFRTGQVLPSREEISLGRENWVKTFSGHGDRVDWLKKFLKESKAEMMNVIPKEEGFDFDLLSTKEKAIEFIKKYQDNPALKNLVIDTAGHIKNELDLKMAEFDSIDAQSK